MHIYMYRYNNLVRLQRQAVVEDRPDCNVEKNLVAAEDEHHLEEYDGGRPEQAPAGTRRMHRRRKLKGRVMVQHDAPHDQEEEAEPPASRETVDKSVALRALVVVGVGQPSKRHELAP